MTARLILVVPLLAGASAWLGTVTPWWAAVPLSAVAGFIIANQVWAVHRSRIRAVAHAVNSWMGESGHVPVEVPGAPHWQELAVAVNALGAAFERRGVKLRRERPWRAQLVDAITVPALLFDDEGQLIAANGPARSQLRLPADQRLTAVQALGSPALADAVRVAREIAQPVEVEARVDERDVRGVASPVGDEVLLVLADRTAQRQLGRIRRDFVANASHELKTPVAGIQSLADALEVVVDDPDRTRQVAGRIREEAARLGQLVHDLLDLQRLEDPSGEEPQPVDLAQVVRDEADRCRDDAGSRGVTIAVEVPERAVVVAYADDLRLIVSNLLRNAVQYNVDGGRVDATLVKRDAAWELQVRDTGIGMPSDAVPRIFERFFRVDVARSREAGGTGLGLSLVRNAAERHGGRVSAESLLGEGSTFRVVLPVEPPV